MVSHCGQARSSKADGDHYHEPLVGNSRQGSVRWGRTSEVGDKAIVGGEELRREGQLSRVGNEHLRLVLRCGRAQRPPRVQKALVHHVHLHQMPHRSGKEHNK